MNKSTDYNEEHVEKVRVIWYILLALRWFHNVAGRSYQLETNLQHLIL